MPTALAVSPTGVLYVIDIERNQILRRLSDGRFQVVAGNGHRGFAGDGGPALNAEVSLRYQSSLAIASNGTVYFADNGNGRVREILPNGVIQTVAGGGDATLGTEPVAATRADLGVNELNGVTLGPNHELYLADNGVYRLERGVLHWVVGSVEPRLNRGFRGYNMNPAVQKDFDPAYTLAFDGDGNLLVGGGNTWSLYERTPEGALHFVQEDRGEPGLYRAMATEPNGDVVLAGGVDGFSTFHPSGSITWHSAPALSTLLPRGSTFAAGEGTAVAFDGAVYLDTDANNGFSRVSAIEEITPSGRDVLIWES